MSDIKSKFIFPLWLDKFYVSGPMFYSLMYMANTAHSNRIPVVYSTNDYSPATNISMLTQYNSDIVASVVEYTPTEVDGIVLLEVEWKTGENKVRNAFYNNPSIWDIRPLIDFQKLIGFEIVKCAGVIRTTEDSIRNSIRGTKLEEFILSLTPEELDDFCELGYPEVYGRLIQVGVREDVCLKDLYDAINFLGAEVEILSRWSSPMKVMNTTIQNEETRLDK